MPTKNLDPANEDIPCNLPPRRAFLGAGVAAAASLGSGGVAEAAGKRFVRRTLSGKKIDTAIATICCDGFGDEDFKHSFEAIPKLGIKNVEFNVWYPRNLTPSGLESIKQRCRQHRLRPISLQAAGFAAGDRNDDICREVSRFMWLIEGCRRLGCRIIKCTGSKRDTRGGLDGIIKVVKEVAPAAEQAGVALVLENHRENNLEFPEDYEKVFAAIDSPAVGICFDMGHFAASGVDLDGFVNRFAEKIFHVDVKDVEKLGSGKFVRYGTGIVPLEATIEHILSKGYQGYLVVELSLIDRETMMDDLRAGYALTKRYER